MLFGLGDIVASWKAIANALPFWRDNDPIDDIADLEQFVATRAAFVAQKTLYGYLKARIGTRYPRVFDDETFVRSINIAKYHVFAGCLSDLAIYAVATALENEEISDESRSALAKRCFQEGLNGNSSDVPIEFKFDDTVQTFAGRLEITKWASDALHWNNFSESPRALIRWAPIADHLKDDDAEIVRNSIKFAWRDVREQFRKRLVREHLLADCRRQLKPSTGVEADVLF
ncbi:MAG: hypothetical protein ACR2QH_03530 [Geminicoccaceae bacterium]